MEGPSSASLRTSSDEKLVASFGAIQELSWNQYDIAALQAWLVHSTC